MGSTGHPYIDVSEKDTPKEEWSIHKMDSDHKNILEAALKMYLDENLDRRLASNLHILQKGLKDGSDSVQSEIKHLSNMITKAKQLHTAIKQSI